MKHQSQTQGTFAASAPHSAAALLNPTTSANAAVGPRAPNHAIHQTAERLGFSAAATQGMWSAMQAGRGRMAQFNHPEFGGSGQWMRGGMVMVGDMFNRTLAGRVASLAEALSALFEAQPPAERHCGNEPTWWDAELGSPSASGSQNGIRYAYFAASRRLAIEDNGHVEIYDTGTHEIRGVSQQQGASRTLTFTSQLGQVPIEALSKVSGMTTTTDERPLKGARGSQIPPETKSRAPTWDVHAIQNPHGSLDPLTAIERLAVLHAKGTLTDEEFAANKKELMARF